MVIIEIIKLRHFYKIIIIKYCKNMESLYVPKMPDEDTLCEYFPTIKDHLHLVLNNKYFYIDRKKKQSNKQPQKGKLSKTEWFESLDIEERVEALSTIATDNLILLEAISNDIKKYEDKTVNYQNPDQNPNFNSENLNTTSADNQTIGYYSQNWQVSLTPELNSSLYKLINSITFLDFK